MPNKEVVTQGVFFRRMTILTAEQCKAIGDLDAFSRVMKRKYLKVEKGALDPLDYKKLVPEDVFLRFISTDPNAVLCRIDDFRFLSSGELIGRVMPDESNYPGVMERLLRLPEPVFRFEPRIIERYAKTRRRPVTREVVTFDFVYL